MAVMSANTLPISPTAKGPLLAKISVDTASRADSEIIDSKKKLQYSICSWMGQKMI